MFFHIHRLACVPSLDHKKSTVVVGPQEGFVGNKMIKMDFRIRDRGPLLFLPEMFRNPTLWYRSVAHFLRLFAQVRSIVVARQ